MANASSWVWTIGGLFFFWLASAGLSEALFGNSPSPPVVAAAITLVLGVVIVVTDVSHETAIFLGVPGMIALFMLVVSIPLVRILLWYTLWIPLVSLTEYAMTIPYLTGTVVLGLAGAIGTAILYTIRKTGPAVDWSLTLRMVVSPLVLAVLLVGFFTAIWRILEFVVRFGLSLVGVGFGTRTLVAQAVTVGLLAAFVYFEFGRISTVERYGDATTVTPNEFPTLDAIATKVATQLDIPMPTIAVAERSEPEAITVGYRPKSITLILSRGTLDTLNEDELEAVVAHELAHVANMDAMVTTVTSLPMLLADGLQSRIYDLKVGDEPGFILTTLLIIATLTEYVSRPIVAGLSRTRELAADRTAATVIGSPATLANALRTLDGRIAEIPAEDRRKASNLSSLSILPLDPIDANFFTSKASDTMKFIGSVLARIEWVFLATHPPTERRIEALTALSEEQQTES